MLRKHVKSHNTSIGQKHIRGILCPSCAVRFILNFQIVDKARTPWIKYGWRLCKSYTKLKESSPSELDINCCINKTDVTISSLECSCGAPEGPHLSPKCNPHRLGEIISHPSETLTTAMDYSLQQACIIRTEVPGAWRTVAGIILKILLFIYRNQSGV